MMGDKRFIEKKLHDDRLVIDKRFKENLKKQLFESEELTMAKVTQLNIKQLFNQKNFRFASAFAVVLMATTVFYALDNRSESLSRQNTIKSVVELPQNLSGVLGADEMRTLAEKDAPAGATITQVEIENEHGAVLYKVKFSDGSFRLYDAVTGLPYVDTASGEVENDESVPAGFVAGITIQQARDTAAAQRPGKTITKIELETEEGKVVYSVRFSDDGRVDVDATNGSVVRVRGADGVKTSDDSNDDSQDDSNSDDSNEDSDDSKDSEDHSEEDTEDDGDRSGSNSGSGSSDDN